MELTGKKILVTGGGGFLGSCLLSELKRQGVRDDDVAAPRMDEFDLRKRSSCAEAVFGKNIVFHLAGVTGDGKFHHDYPADIFYSNVIMGVELMEAARKAGVEKFIGLGSATEYPAGVQVPFREEDLWEGALDELHAPYSFAKKMLLVQSQAYRTQYGFNAIHLMPTNMYGPRDHDRFVIPTLIRTVAEALKTGKSSITVGGTGSPTRDFLFVEDAARGIILAAERYDGTDPVNLGSGIETSIRDLVEVASRLMGYTGTVQWDSSRPDGPMRRALDTTRAERELGFRAGTSLEEGLKKTIAWYNHQA